MATISIAEIVQLQRTNHVVAFYPRKNLVVVDGFKRYFATNAAIKATKTLDTPIGSK